MAKVPAGYISGVTGETTLPRRRQKIAVIGASGLNSITDDCQVTSFTWQTVERLKNASDYDRIIINLLDVDKKNAQWRLFFDILNLATVGQIIRAGGEIVCIGDPRFDIPLSPTNTRAFLSWTGLTFVWDNKPGDIVESNVAQHPLKRYLSHQDKWDYLLHSCVGQRLTDGYYALLPYLGEDPRGNLQVRLENLTTNRVGNSLAFDVHERKKEAA